MSDLQSVSFEAQDLSDFVEKSYLDYAMYVILDRALPHISDGLKPVQRRLVYAMSELGLSAQAKFKKSARTVGDVLGKYHPHGDSACYKAMVLMAQSFSYRYPLIDGQGNWGSADEPKSFAAMRYTESRLTNYAKSLLEELGQATVDWGANFDGTLREPLFLPARLPNILLNGSSGIAVGMSTDIPPHNLREVARACQALLQNPDLSLDELLSFLPAPDYPTGAELINTQAEIREMYATGQGSLRLRACYRVEEGNVVIEELPYQVSGARIQEQIAKQMQDKKLPWLEDVRDESDHEHPTRLVLVLRSSRVDCARLMSHLFATTDLEKSYRVQMNVIGLDGKPQVKGLLPLLSEWLQFREATLLRRLNYEYDCVSNDLEIVEGLLRAFLDLDEVIRIIRESDHAKEDLMARFALSARQAEAILNTRLRHLARLEEMELQAREADLKARLQALRLLLDGRDARLNLLVEEFQQDAKAYGDARRTLLVERTQAQALQERDLLPSEAITVVLSKMAWIRSGKGTQLNGEALSYKSGDGFLLQFAAKSNQSAYFLADNGRVFSHSLHALPSARGYGEPLSSVLSLEAGHAILDAGVIDEARFYLLASDYAYGFLISGAELLSKTKTGKALLNVGEGRALPLLSVADKERDLLLAISSEGRALIYPVCELPVLNKGKGNQIIAVSRAMAAKGVRLACLKVFKEDDDFYLLSGKKRLKFFKAEREAYFGSRGQKGVLLPKGFQKVSAFEDFSSVD